MPTKIFSFVYALNYITQAAIMMVIPAGLIIAGGWLLTYRCGVGKWAMVVSIVLGVLAGIYSLFSFLVSTMNHIDPTDQKGAKENDRNR
ncbi:MAG: AtpZ/AtpI family protein [Ruminococcaceae bacterium]|nr:AtpZ/AtpI family protein [Oscillospiraceae bacterium]